MVILSLDTSEIVAGLSDRSSATRRPFDMARENGVELVVSSIVVHELTGGAALSARPRMQSALLEAYLADVEQIDFNAEDARESGVLWASLRQAGRLIGDIDTLIAGQALARGWTVVTRNIRHFGRVEGLPLIDWSEGSEPLTPERIAARVAGDI